MDGTAFASSILCVPLRTQVQGEGLSPRRRSRPRTGVRCAVQGTPDVPAAASPSGAAAGGQEIPKRYTEVTNVLETNGGWMVDADVHNFRQHSTHTVIVGKELIEELCEGLEGRPTPEQLTSFAFDYFMQVGKSLTNTEGLMDPGTFPINYFSVRQMFYFYPDAKEKLIEMIKAALTQE